MFLSSRLSVGRKQGNIWHQSCPQMRLSIISVDLNEARAILPSHISGYSKLNSNVVESLLDSLPQRHRLSSWTFDPNSRWIKDIWWGLPVLYNNSKIRRKSFVRIGIYWLKNSERKNYQQRVSRSGRFHTSQFVEKRWISILW